MARKSWDMEQPEPRYFYSTLSPTRIIGHILQYCDEWFCFLDETESSGKSLPPKFFLPIFDLYYVC